MKNKKMKIELSILLTLLVFGNSINAQIKVINDGSVGIGLTTPSYPLHVWGWGQLFNYNGMEIKFKANNGQQSDIGSSNTGVINFWNSNCWANGGWNRLKANQYNTVSDERLKKNISSLNGNLAIIKQLQPKQYNYIDSIVTSESSRLRYGFLAQQIIQVIPDLVDTSRGVYSLDYSGVIPFLVGAVKEQSNTIDSLRALLVPTTAGRASNNNSNNQSELNDLKQQLQDLKNKVNYFENNCCATINTSGNNFNNNSSNTLNNLNNNDDLLLQNVPNPFENSTTIKFNIPIKYNGNFFIKIYKISGEELQSYRIKKEDKEIHIDGSMLVNGVYNYALISNSDILQLKQMIISR